MNLTASNKIHVRVLLAADVVASVEIQPRVRPPLGRIFAGKQASSLLNAVPRLFALCAAAQQTALLTAIETARDEVITLAKKTASYCADRYRAHHGFGTGPICRTSHARGRQCGSNPLPDVGIVSACSLRPASLVPPLNGKQQRGSRRRWPRWAYRMRDARSGPAAHCRFASRRFMRPAPR